MKRTDLPKPYYLSVPEAAKLCGVSRNTLYTWVRKGKLPAYQTPGRTNMIRPSDLVGFMNNSGLFVPPRLQELAQVDETTNEPVTRTEPGAEQDLRVVLVVDDDPLVRSLMVRALNDVYRLYQARTGFEALHMLTMHPEIEIVLLDLRMRGQHGLDTLKEIEALRPDVRVVVVTGYSEEMPMDDAAHSQVDRVLVKPVGIADLKNALKEVEQKLPDTGKRVSGNGPANPGA